MSAVSQFQSIYAQIYNTVDRASRGPMIRNLFDCLADAADLRVYSYDARPDHKAERRYKIASQENFEVMIEHGMSEITYEFHNITALRNGVPNEVEIVEEGKEWGQNYPGPRKFMDEGRDNYVERFGYEDFTSALAAAGFTVE